MAAYYYIAGGVLVLDPVQLLSWEQVPVWDGPTYLYTIHRLHFRGTYNPATFSWMLQGAPGDAQVSVNVPGQVAPNSNTATRHFLMQARGQLAYNIGLDPSRNPVYAIISPTIIPGSDQNGGSVQYLTDAANGPMPLHCNVVEAKGTKTFIVDWAIETYINECYLFQASTSLSALLSQRWTIEEDLDQDFFATRTIKGHAIFRSDRLLALSAIPDDYRAWLFHPVQDNFQRTVQQVIPSADGLRIDYVLIDRERPFNLVPAVAALGVTRIEAFYRQGYSRKVGLEESGIRLIGAAFERGGESVPMTNDPGRGVRELGGFVKDAIGIALDYVPRYNQNLVVRVWGNRQSTRANLASVAFSIFNSRIGSSLSILGSGSIDVGEDLMGKFIEMTVNVQSGPIEALVKNGSVFLSTPTVGPDELVGVTQTAPAANPTAPLDSGTRSSLYSAMAQVLSGACGLTPQANINRLRQIDTPSSSQALTESVQPQTSKLTSN